MEALFVYIVKVNVLLALFYILYKGLFERTTFYRENRFYFLFSLVISFGLPLLYLTITVWIAPISSVNHNSNLALASTIPSEPLHYLFYVVLISLLISIILIFKLLTNTFKTKALNKKDQPLQLNGIKYFDQIDIKTPFSFWDSIYFNSQNYSESELKIILLHEETHIRQKHSIDLLFIQIICCLFWFNPLVWKLKSSINKNLEYLTDHSVLEVMNEKSLYQKTLLKTMGITVNNELTHSFNQSFLKMRIMKINQNQTQKLQRWRFSLPLCGALIFIFLFQVKTVAQVQKNSAKASQPLEKRVIRAAPAAPPEPPQAPVPPDAADIPTPPLPPSPEPIRATSPSNDNKNTYTTSKYTVSSHQTREATQKEIAVAKKDHEAHQRHAEQARKDAEIARKDAEAIKRDADAARKDAEAIKRDAEAARKDAEAIKRDDEAARKDAEAARKDITLTKKEHLIKQRDIEIAKTNRMTAERNRKVANTKKQATVADKAAYKKNRETAQQNVSKPKNI